MIASMLPKIYTGVQVFASTQTRFYKKPGFVLFNTLPKVADFGLCFAQSINDWIRGILPRGQPRLKSRNFAFFGINRNGPGRAKASIFTPHFFRKTTCLFYKNITRQNSRRLCHFLFSNLFSIFLRKSTWLSVFRITGECSIILSFSTWHISISCSAKRSPKLTIQNTLTSCTNKKRLIIDI